MPFRTPGVGLPRRHGFATTAPVVDVFAPVKFLTKSHELGPRPRTPLPLGARFSELDAVR